MHQESSQNRRRTGRFAAPLLLLAVIVLTALTSYLGIASAQVERNPYLTLSILQLLIYVVPAILFAKIRGRASLGELKLRLVRPRQMPFVLCAAITLISGSCALKFVLHYLNTGVFRYGASAYNVSSSNVLSLAVALAIIPAITEEFLLRSVIFTEYESYGPPCAVILSGLMFAMLHFDPTMIPVYFFAGVLLAFVVYTTRSVLAAMIVHMVYNLFSLFGEQYFWIPMTTPRYATMFILVLFALLLLSLVFLFGEASRIFRHYAVSDIQLPRQEMKKSRYRGAWAKLIPAIASPTFLLCLLLYIIAVITVGRT